MNTTVAPLKKPKQAKKPSALDRVIHDIEVVQSNIDAIRAGLETGRGGKVPDKSQDRWDTLAAAHITLRRVAEALEDIA